LLILEAMNWILVYCVMLIHMLFHFYVSIWFPCLMHALVWPPMHDLCFLRCWKMSFEPRTEIECLMELVSRNRIWFIRNIKTFDLSAWFYLLRIQGIGTWWVIIDSKSLGTWFEYSTISSNYLLNNPISLRYICLL